MSSLRPRRPSPAFVLSLIALFVALGGTGYAALKLPKNSVGTKQLKKNAVTGSKVKNGSLTGADIKPGSITGSSIALSGLGTVPAAANAAHAASADNAINAGHANNADTVGGRTAITFSKLVATNTTTPQMVFSLGGLTVQLACNATGKPTLTGIHGVGPSLLRGTAVSVGSGTTTYGSSNGAAGHVETIFTPTDERGTATFEYAQTDGHVVSVNLYVDDTNTVGTFDGCSASGSAISG
ncbi:MAG TPA: hypothetical protein VJU60_11445 [Thermoleophilaceae bacterium]|nr:hypothetical protein [Thermoleophilaceae bacterium]